MRLIPKLKELVGQWPDPYEYECTVCDRTFQNERATCPDCGGEVQVTEERRGRSPADPHP